MKRKTTFFVAILMLTGSTLYFSGCKKTVESIIDEQCTVCTETISGVPADEYCATASLVEVYESTLSATHTCVRK